MLTLPFHQVNILLPMRFLCRSIVSHLRCRLQLWLKSNLPRNKVKTPRSLVLNMKKWIWIMRTKNMIAVVNRSWRRFHKRDLHIISIHLGMFILHQIRSVRAIQNTIQDITQIIIPTHPNSKDAKTAKPETRNTASLTKVFKFKAIHWQQLKKFKRTKW